MYQSRSTFPQGAALGYGQHLGLQPAPIIYRAFVQIGSFSTDLRLRLGIVQASLASALALHKRSIKYNQFQVKTQPIISDGFEVQTIHSQRV